VPVAGPPSDVQTHDGGCWGPGRHKAQRKSLGRAALWYTTGHVRVMGECMAEASKGVSGKAGVRGPGGARQFRVASLTGTYHVRSYWLAREWLWLECGGEKAV
jgi:hypothetical protein